MVSGACFAIGAAAFEEIGGFDERYFMYFEDADLCRRATAAGWPIRYLPDVVVDHVGGASSAVDYHFGPRHAAPVPTACPSASAPTPAWGSPWRPARCRAAVARRWASVTSRDMGDPVGVTGLIVQ